MEPIKIKFEDMKELNYGDLVITTDPFLQEETPYVLMSNDNDKSFYFISEYGGSLMVDKQETIDGFNVRLIDETHPKWIQSLSDHGKQLGEMMDMFNTVDNIH